MIDNLLAGVAVVEAKTIDFNAELKYIADWLEKPNDVENFGCAFDGEPTTFTSVEELDEYDMHQRDTLTLLDYELMLQHSIEQGIVENFAEFVKDEGKSITRELQSNSKMHI